jgi:signal transduction histidine kinase
LRTTSTTCSWSLSGNLDLLKDSIPADAPELDLIDSSLTAALAGSELSNSLLAFSRQNVFKLEAVNIKTIAADQVRLLKRAMGRNVTLEDTSLEDVFSITADAAQLRCALTNLVENRAADRSLVWRLTHYPGHLFP